MVCTYECRLFQGEYIYNNYNYNYLLIYREGFISVRVDTFRQLRTNRIMIMIIVLLATVCLFANVNKMLVLKLFLLSNGNFIISYKLYVKCVFINSEHRAGCPNLVHAPL